MHWLTRCSFACATIFTEPPGTSSKSKPYVVGSSRSGPGSDKPLDASGSIFPQPFPNNPSSTSSSSRLNSAAAELFPAPPKNRNRSDTHPGPDLSEIHSPNALQTPRQPHPFFANPPVTPARFRVGPLLESFFNTENTVHCIIRAKGIRGSGRVSGDQRGVLRTWQLPALGSFQRDSQRPRERNSGCRGAAQPDQGRGVLRRESSDRSTGDL